MKNTKTQGLIIAVLGLLMFCAICPLALNNMVAMATSSGRPQDIVSLYGKLFPNQPLTGNIFLSNVIITLQEICACVLSVGVLAIGALLFSRSRQPAE